VNGPSSIRRTWIRSVPCPVEGCGHLIEMDPDQSVGIYRCPCRFRLLVLTADDRLIEAPPRRVAAL
jgi:hypothetical protein